MHASSVGLLQKKLHHRFTHHTCIHAFIRIPDMCIIPTCIRVKVDHSYMHRTCIMCTCIMHLATIIVFNLLRFFSVHLVLYCLYRHHFHHIILLHSRIQHQNHHARLKYMYFSICLLYTSPSPRDRQKSRMPSSA